VTDIFGPIFDGSVLSRAVLSCLEAWYPTYIQEIEVQRGYPRGKIPHPKTYTERWQFDSYPDDKIPVVVAVCPGMAEPPEHTGDGVYGGWWALGVGIIAAASTEENSERLAKVYGAAARAILMQKSYISDDWEFAGVDLVDESYDDIPDMEQARTMRAVQIITRVRVENVVTIYGGPQYPIPPDPETQPGSDWPTADTVDVTIKRKEEEG